MMSYLSVTQRSGQKHGGLRGQKRGSCVRICHQQKIVMSFLRPVSRPVLHGLGVDSTLFGLFLVLVPSIFGLELRHSGLDRICAGIEHAAYPHHHRRLGSPHFTTHFCSYDTCCMRVPICSWFVAVCSIRPISLN